MSRFKQRRYLPLILPLILLIAVLAVKQDWSIAGGSSQTYTNKAQITSFTDSFGAHTLDPPVTAEAHVIVTSTSAQEELCFIPPVLTAEAGTNQSITCGSVVILGGSPTATGGTPPYAYQWSCDQPSCNITNSTDASPTVIPDFRETIYTVVVTDGNSCVASDSVLVAIQDAPQAVVTASPTVACIDEPVDFDGSVSTGVPPLVYNWDFGDGTLLFGGPATYTYSYSTEGIFNASLTVIDNNGAGCRDTAFIDIYVSGFANVPTGRIYFTFSQDPIPADGISIALATSNVIYGCDGMTPIAGAKITVMTDRGTILDGQLIDEDSAPGIQISTDISGQISFTLQSDTIGGIATVMARSVDGYAEGASQIEFLGSTSLPIVTGFYPSGYLGAVTPVSEIYVQFNKDMDDMGIGSVCNNFTVWDITNTLQVNCNCYYDRPNRMAIFTPVGGPINMSFMYEVTITGNVVDIYGNSLDGNYDGFPQGSPLDNFVWTFGNTTDQIDPIANCIGHAPNVFSPDGDGIEDFTTINAQLQDTGTGIRMWQVIIQNEFGDVVRTLIEELTGGPTDIAGSLDWNGKDEDGMVVDNGVYNYMLKVIDNDGNWFIAICNDQILVESALDPAYFRGKSGSVD